MVWGIWKFELLAFRFLINHRISFIFRIKLAMTSKKTESIVKIARVSLGFCMLTFIDENSYIFVTNSKLKINFGPYNLKYDEEEEEITRQAMKSW